MYPWSEKYRLCRNRHNSKKIAKPGNEMATNGVNPNLHWQIRSAYGSRTQFSHFASLRDFAANTRLNCSYLRRGKNAALLFSCRITKFPCPNLSEMPRARAR